MINNKNIIGEWELYEIIDKANDTIYYSPCDPTRDNIQTIEFTNDLLRIDSLNDKAFYYSELKIGGYPKLTSYYSILPNDSLEFHCVTRLLGGFSGISNDFLDFYSRYLCQDIPFKISFSDRFLSLKNSPDLILRFISASEEQ